jgi:prepilin-type N-terminal cleavage/methylation domain-containing protein
MRRLSSESGMTLVEMLVTMVIGSLVLATGLTLITTSERASSRIRDRVDANQRGRTSMEQVTQRVRAMSCLPDTTPPIVAASADTLTFYADLDSDTNFDPEQWRLTAVRNAGGQLTGIREERWAGLTPPVAGGPNRTRVVAHNIGATRNAANQNVPLFRYYEYPTVTAVTPVQFASNPVPAGDLRRIVRVDVAFESQPTSGVVGHPTSTFETSVYARSVRRTVSTVTFDCTG